LTNITAVSILAYEFPNTNHIHEISPRPVLLLTTETAHSRPFSETTFEKLQEPKELYVAPAADHVDFYDRVDLIPFAKLETFFKNAFAN
jgi:fermentation-respiration switch protein FrsA (DUF1100 family)